jgi:transposase
MGVVGRAAANEAPAGRLDEFVVQIGSAEWRYTRHGTTSLFAALDIATVKVIGKCYSRHRAAEFRKFLDEIEAAVPRGLEVHLVMDNYAAHKAPLIRNWLAKRPRWHVHLTPTSSSWLNQVERFFALITDKKDSARHLSKRPGSTRLRSWRPSRLFLVTIGDDDEYRTEDDAQDQQQRRCSDADAYAWPKHHAHERRLRVSHEQNENEVATMMMPQNAAAKSGRATMASDSGTCILLSLFGVSPAGA